MSWEYLVATAKALGVPAGVAVYFMIRDWMFMAESIKLQTQTVELLRQLVTAARFGG
jgi:hypothetical protein